MRCGYALDSVAGPLASKTVAGGIAIGAILGIATDQWDVIGVGLVIGIIARWAYIMSVGNRVTLRDALVDIMMVLPNGVLAINLVDTAHIHDARLLLVAAMLGSGSTLAFVYARTQFNRWQGASDAPTTVFAAANTTVHVPASAHEVTVQTVGYPTPQSVSEFAVQQMAETKPEPPSGEFLRILSRIEDPEP